MTTHDVTQSMVWYERFIEDDDDFVPDENELMRHVFNDWGLSWGDSRGSYFEQTDVRAALKTFNTRAYRMLKAFGFVVVGYHKAIWRWVRDVAQAQDRGGGLMDTADLLPYHIPDISAGTIEFTREHAGAYRGKFEPSEDSSSDSKKRSPYAYLVYVREVKIGEVFTREDQLLFPGTRWIVKSPLRNIMRAKAEIAAYATDRRVASFENARPLVIKSLRPEAPADAAQMPIEDALNDQYANGELESEFHRPYLGEGQLVQYFGTQPSAGAKLTGQAMKVFSRVPDANPENRAMIVDGNFQVGALRAASFNVPLEELRRKASAAIRRYHGLPQRTDGVRGTRAVQRTATEELDQERERDRSIATAQESMQSFYTKVHALVLGDIDDAVASRAREKWDLQLATDLIALREARRSGNTPEEKNAAAIKLWQTLQFAEQVNQNSVAATLEFKRTKTLDPEDIRALTDLMDPTNPLVTALRSALLVKYLESRVGDLQELLDSLEPVGALQYKNTAKFRLVAKEEKQSVQPSGESAAEPASKSPKTDTNDDDDDDEESPEPPTKKRKKDDASTDKKKKKMGKKEKGKRKSST